MGFPSLWNQMLNNKYSIYDKGMMFSPTTIHKVAVHIIHKTGFDSPFYNRQTEILLCAIELEIAQRCGGSSVIDGPVELFLM